MIELSEQAGILALEGCATHAEATDLRRLLLERAASASSPPHALDLSGLQALDLAGAQVLLSLRRQPAFASVRVEGCPPALVSYLRTCGLAGPLLGAG